MLSLRSDGLTWLMRTATHLGDTSVLLLVVLVVAAVLMSMGRTRDGLLLAVSMGLGSAFVVYGLKPLFGRARPDALALVPSPSTASFPSGHAFSTLLFVGLAMLLSRSHGAKARVAQAAASVAIVLVVGFSRVYLGVHWATDVVGGWLLAAVWLVCTALIARKPSRGLE